MKLNNSFKLSTLMLGVLALVTSCGSGIEDKVTTAGYTGCKTASCYTNAITDAQWAAALADPVDLTMTKTSNPATAPTDKSNYVYSSTKFISPTDHTLVFEAGKPYVLKFTSPYSTLTSPTTDASANNDQEHYFTSPGFYSSIAIKKIVTTAATYNVPYLNDFELNKPINNAEGKVAYIYFVAVKTGTWGAQCKEGNHSSAATKQGMYATVTITGTPNLPLDFEIASDFDTALGNPLEPRKDSATNAYKTLWGGTITSSTAQTGTVTNAAVSGTVVGVDTLFTTELVVGGSITIGGSTKVIATIADNTHLTITGTITAANSAVPYYKATVISNTVNTAGSTATLTEASGATNFNDVTLTLNSGNVLRFTKTGTPAGKHTLTSNFFRKALFRKIQDQDVQIKPYYLNSVEFNPIKTGTAISTSVPGVGQIDFWVSPIELGTFNFDFTDLTLPTPVTTTSKIIVQ